MFSSESRNKRLQSFDQWKKLFDLRTNDKIRKITTDQGDDSTTGCLIDYPHFKENPKFVTIDLSKQQKLDADPKAIHKLILLEI